MGGRYNVDIHTMDKIKKTVGVLHFLQYFFI